MKNALQYSHSLLNDLIHRFPNGLFIDATLGKGHDTAFILKQECFTGQVFAFDIQEQAIQLAQERLEKFSHHQYHLFHAGHESLNEMLPFHDYPEIHGAIFNLGYLPGGNHSVTTQFHTTLEAIVQIQERLVSQGQIILVLYSGHPQGMQEKSALLERLKVWSQKYYTICHLEYLNQDNSPPSLLIIEKK